MVTEMQAQRERARERARAREREREREKERFLVPSRSLDAALVLLCACRALYLTSQPVHCAVDCRPSIAGGGWIFGSVESSDVVCRDLAVSTDMVVVSVGHRRAPEYKFPTPLQVPPTVLL